MKLTTAYNNRPRSLRDREAGRRAFILANGPSVRSIPLSLLRRELVIGMNASTMLEQTHNFRSEYYVLSDLRFIQAPDRRPWATDKLDDTTHRVVRADLRHADEPTLADRTTYVAALSRNGFSEDLAFGFHYGCTTTMLAIQLAWHLGSREVYLLGCDLRYDGDSPRFYREESPQVEDAFTSIQISNITNAAKHFEQSGGKLVNCSRRSFLRPYLPYVEFAELFPGR